MESLVSDKWIEDWLLNRFGSGNVFEKFNRRFCRDLVDAVLTEERDRVVKFLEEKYPAISSWNFWEEFRKGELPLKRGVK